MVYVDAPRLSSANVVDSVWQRMRNAELYSLTDLANLSGQAVHALIPVMEFLTVYGFAERVTRHEWLFRKRSNLPAPGRTLTVLQTVVASSASRDRMRPQGLGKRSHERW